jgi:hypothetical protein
MEARPKPGPEFPVNMSKRGLPARLSAPNQTLTMVNARLPKGNLPAASDAAKTRGGKFSDIAGDEDRKNKTARLPEQMGGSVAAE